LRKAFGSSARDISALTDRIDVLVNNAGGMAKSKVLTVEGYEENFAGNHLGPFLLTTRLLPLLRHARYVLSENPVTGLAFGLFAMFLLAAILGPARDL